MNEHDAVRAVSDWGRKLSDAYKAQDRMCSGGGRTDLCKESAYISISGSYMRMAKRVVGFTKYASYSSATGTTLAVVCLCPGCNELYWFHINKVAVQEFATHCPLWPDEQKEKFVK